MGRGVGLKALQVRAPKGQRFKKLNRFCRALVPMSRSGWGLSGHGWGQVDGGVGTDSGHLRAAGGFPVLSGSPFFFLSPSLLKVSFMSPTVSTKLLS